jgi:predicted ester cyclase
MTTTIKMAQPSSLDVAYSAYIAALNKRPFPGLADHVHPDVRLNGSSMPLAEYEKLLTDDIAAAPDLSWDVSMLVIDESTQRVGCRIEFTCTPLGEFMGRKVQGTVKCMEHMFYQYRDGRIVDVWWMPGELLAVDSNGTSSQV